MRNVPVRRNVEVRSSNGWAGMYAARAFEPGERVISIRGDERAAPDRYSIQVDEEEHVHPTDDKWKYLNHSCEPNLAYVPEPRSFVAVRPIARGEELSFNYLTTEWDMAEAFECDCGAAGCHGRIAGFRHLSREDRERLLPEAAPHIRELLVRNEVEG